MDRMGVLFCLVHEWNKEIGAGRTIKNQVRRTVLKRAERAESKRLASRSAISILSERMGAGAVPADEASLTAGARLYRDHCSLCHGDPAHPKSPLTNTLNPPLPQFMTDMADMPENQNFYILQHGIRWTAMPGWKNVLSERLFTETVHSVEHPSASH